MPRLGKMIFVWVFQNIWCCDLWITPCLKWSLLCIVECDWSFLSQSSYMSIHYFHSHQINILFFKAICQNLCVPRMIRQPPCPKLSRTHWMIWHTPGSSGPGTLGIYSPRPLEALTLSHSFLPPPPLVPSLRAWRFEASAVGFCCEGVLWIPHASETLFPSIFSPEHLGFARESSR